MTMISDSIKKYEYIFFIDIINFKLGMVRNERRGQC